MLNNLTRSIKLGCLKYLLWFACRQMHCIAPLAFGKCWVLESLFFFGVLEQFSLAVGNNALSEGKDQ